MVSIPISLNVSSKPKDTPFHQQKLPAWQPMITVGTLYPLFFAVSLLFIPIGAILLISSNNINELVLSYTYCTMSDNQSSLCADQVQKPDFFANYGKCRCALNFTLNKPISGQVYLYYALDRFYQNHRRSAQSKDNHQLLGYNVNNHLNDKCEPYKYANSSSKIAIAPCGTLANSIFNDTFRIFLVNKNESIEVSMTNKNIAWSTDVSRKFGIPKSWSDTTKPVNWPVSEYNRSHDAYSGDEELLVWMRTAPLPYFRKLHRIINHDSHQLFKNGLPAGIYEIQINYSYPVTAFSGAKYVILSSTSFMGGKNPVLGTLYILMGMISLCMSAVFVVLNHRSTKRSQTKALAYL